MGCVENSGVSQLQALLGIMHPADSNRKREYHVLLSEEAKVRGRGLRRSVAVRLGVRDTKCMVLGVGRGERQSVLICESTWGERVSGVGVQCLPHFTGLKVLLSEH